MDLPQVTLLTGPGQADWSRSLDGLSLTIRLLSWDEPWTRLLRNETADLLAAIVPEAGKLDSLFEWMEASDRSTAVLVVAVPGLDRGSLERVAEIADDFAIAPVSDFEFAGRVRRLLRARSPSAKDRLMVELGMGELVGQAPAFRAQIDRIPVVARSHAPVLIEGETGTGKELCARAVHHLGPDRDGPFVAVDCAAIPEHLMENELFGHVRGAYTDAQSTQRGLVSLTDGGTLFLDEVDSLSLNSQAKLLRFLQEGTYRPLGSEQFLRARVRVVSATNRDLASCVAAKTFRSDLYYRLNVLRLELPPLRERPEDIALLAAHFARNAGQKVLSPAVMHRLEHYHWPGNVRELQNVIERSAVLSDAAQILPSAICLPEMRSAERTDTVQRFGAARAQALRTFERDYVSQLLREHNGNITHAARAAGKERRAFGRLAKKHGLTSAAGQ